MKFQKGTRRKAIEYEKDIIKYWKDNNVFQKSVDQRSDDNSYVFYDGPPFITGEPHYGTLLSSIIKDSVPRYWTMKGKKVERTWGWDCHGLPAEVFTEKKLGIKDKRDIGTKISLEEYIMTCRDNMVQTGNLWEDTIDRIGRWVEFKGAYKTMDKDYMESVWWAFKELYNKNKIYEGEKVLLYCTRDATPISKAEVTMDNSYQDVTDPSVFVKFKLKGSEAFLLAWTTTPWTLPANTAVAVNKNESYTEVEIDGINLILASERVDSVLRDEKHQPLEFKIKRELKGEELVGMSYEPLFEDNIGNNSFKIWHADYVNLDDGSGIVHIAPSYGEEDYELAIKCKFPIINIIDDNGIYTSGDWSGQQIWESNKIIAKALHEKKIVWKIEYIRHSYPHCHRCGTKLMYRAHPSWFMDIQSQKQDMVNGNKDIGWYPEHIKNGRFAKTIETAPDWNLSRDRFWATPIPVWKAKDKDGNELIKVIGSYAELEELSGVKLDDYHRPWIDDIKFEIDGNQYTRIEKVLDCWFESGSMPFAQFHYPFENKEKFENNFPGDFIAEYVGQVRAWFYYLHAISIGLFGEKSFKNVIVTGTVLGEDGRKLSKSLNNYTDPNLTIDKYSADAVRFLLLSSPVISGEDFSLIEKDIADTSRKLSMIWNMYDFFTLYASVDNWEPSDNYETSIEGLSNPLDVWITSRINELTQSIDENMQSYDLQKALKPVFGFIDDASNWYVRRSRRRFWKSGDDKDKNDAYRTLYYVLVKLSIVLAPFTPFLAEELFRNLTGKESVHLLDWPKVQNINSEVVEQMSEVRELIAQGLSIRAKNGLKVRQPLQSVTLTTSSKLTNELIDIVKDELNVKKVQIEVVEDGKDISAELDMNITEELRAEGIVRELIRYIQNERKQSGLEVEDRISLLIESDSPEINNAIEQYLPLIKDETLTQEYGEVLVDSHHSSFKIEGLEVDIYLSKYFA